MSNNNLNILRNIRSTISHLPMNRNGPEKEAANKPAQKLEYTPFNTYCTNNRVRYYLHSFIHLQNLSKTTIQRYPSIQVK